MADYQSQPSQFESRPPSLSETSSDTSSEQPSISSTSTSPPPTPHDIDRWNRHITLEEFGTSLQGAARALFPNGRTSRYAKVTVLVLSWEEEDPKLPVSLEIAQLVRVFKEIYHYDVDEWKIPSKNSHWALNRKIMSFVEPAPNDREHLKIVYYAGHGRLTKTKLLEWTSCPDNPKLHSQTRLQPVQWSGIQVLLEQAESDVLILLDCCAAGTANSGGGSGVTELIAACSYSGTANGVGRYSFTNALITELQELSQRPSFSTGELYRNVFLHAQCHSEHGRDRPAPVHLPLTKQSNFPRSIQLSIQSKTHCDSGLCDHQSEACGDACCGKPDNDPSQEPNAEIKSIVPLPTMKPMSLIDSFVPRLLFAVRLKEGFQPNELSTEMLTEWFRMIPLIGVEEVKIEAGFNSFSSVVIISVPIAMSAFIPMHPAVFCLGPVTSRNLFSGNLQLTSVPVNILTGTSSSESVSTVPRRDKSGSDSGKIRKRKRKALSSTWAKLRGSASVQWENCPTTPSIAVNRSEDKGTTLEKVEKKSFAKRSSENVDLSEKHSLTNSWHSPVEMAPITVFRQVGDVNHDKIMQGVLDGAFKEKSASKKSHLQPANRPVQLDPNIRNNSGDMLNWHSSQQPIPGGNLIELHDRNSDERALTSRRVGNNLPTWSRSSRLDEEFELRPWAATIGSTSSTSSDWTLGWTSNRFAVSSPRTAVSSLRPLSPDSFSTAQKAFMFAVTGAHDHSANLLAAWSWYLDYLYARIRDAWVPLFRQVLQDINMSLYSPLESDLALAMRFLTSIVVELRRSDLALSDIVDGLCNQGIVKETDDERFHTTQLVFVAVGWLTLLYSPNIKSGQRQFELCRPSTEFSTGRTLTSVTSGKNREKNRIRKERRNTIKEYEQSMDYVDQPLVTLLKRFGAILPEPIAEPSERLEVAGSRYEDCIEASMVSFHTLHKVASIHIQWVDSLCLHLEFDQQARTLKLFRFPSVCLIMGNSSQPGLLSQLFRDAQSDWSDSADAKGYFQEVLLSYRLIFGMEKSSYRAFNRLEGRKSRNLDADPDPLLNILCGQSCGESEVVQIFDECDIDNPRMRYNSRTDFPYLGERLMRLQEYSRCHSSTSFVALWFDKRDHMRWWTFWAVLFLGGSSLLIAFLQVFLQVAQLHYALHPGR